jgi:4-hydroxy-2-oxoheptanedioate aldolase
VSPLKKQLRNEQYVLGSMLSEFHNPNIIRMLSTCGCDYLIVDCEHGYFDYSMVAALIAAAKGAGLPIIVRIPEINRECILKYMDMGADGLLVPMVSSPEEARLAVNYAKYAPLGNRGVSTQRAHSDYNVKDLKAYMQHANESTLMLVQVETVRGLEQMESIAAVEGIDGLIIGPNDLMQDMGIAGATYNHPLLKNAMERVAGVAGSYGKWSGVISSKKELVQQGQQCGMQILSWNSEVGMLMQAATEGMAGLREVLSKP